MRQSRQFMFDKDPSFTFRFLRRSDPNGWLHTSASGRSWRLALARNAIYLALGALGLTGEDEVLVPAYICAAAVEPIRAYGATPIFYSINKDCSTDLLDLEGKISLRTRALLLVHYFGFPNRNIRELRSLCDRRDLLLIEDCAHVLCGETDGVPLGQLGEAAVFSFRKFLPVRDGAELRLNRFGESMSINLRRESFTSTLKHAVYLAEQRWPPISPATKRVSNVAKFLRRTTIQQSQEAPTQHGVLLSENSETRFDPCLLRSPMSRLSRWIMAHTDMKAVVERRRDNYFKLTAALREISRVEMPFPELPPGVCPWMLPLTLEGLSNVHKLLRGRGMPAVAWDAVRPRALNGAEFHDADFLYENLFFLPVHQNLEPRHLNEMVSAIKNVRDATRSRPLACSWD
jgi:perosamine synthetase